MFFIFEEVFYVRDVIARIYEKSTRRYKYKTLWIGFPDKAFVITSFVT